MVVVAGVILAMWVVFDSMVAVGPVGGADRAAAAGSADTGWLLRSTDSEYPELPEVLPVLPAVH